MLLLLRGTKYAPRTHKSPSRGDCAEAVSPAGVLVSSVAQTQAIRTHRDTERAKRDAKVENSLFQMWAAHPFRLRLITAQQPSFWPRVRVLLSASSEVQLEGAECWAVG